MTWRKKLSEELSVRNRCIHPLLQNLHRYRQAADYPI